MDRKRAKTTGVAFATVIMMVTVLLSRVLGVVRDAIISHYFGRGAQTDAYNAAFTIPDLLWNLLQSGALASTIVPIVTELRQKGDDRSADRVVSIVASTIFVFIGALIVLMEVFTPQLTRALNPGFDANRIAMSVPLTRVLLPAQMCFFMGGLLMGVLYSRKQFLIPAMGPVIYNLGIIAGAVLLRPFFMAAYGPSRGIEGLVWGAIGGAFIGNLLLPFLAVLRLGVRITPSLNVTDPAAVKVWRMLLPIGLGIGLPSIDQVVNKYFASDFGTGDTTALMNAYRLMLLPIGVFAQSMAIAVFPTLSGYAALKDNVGLRGAVNRSLRNILFLTLPASALMFFLGTPIITFLLQSGKYSGADTAVTASVLRCLSLGICAWSCSSLLTRGFYALQSSKIPAISGAIVSVIFISMNVLVVRYRLGIDWLAISTSVSAGIHCIALLLLLRFRLRGIEGLRLARSAGRIMVATLALSVVAWTMNRLVCAVADTIVMAPKVEAIFALALGGGLGLMAFVRVAELLHMPELEVGRQMVLSKLGFLTRLFGAKPAHPAVPPIGTAGDADAGTDLYFDPLAGGEGASYLEDSSSDASDRERTPRE